MISRHYRVDSYQQAAAVRAVLAEREAQNRKWGRQNHDPFTWIAILIEEVGEAAKEALTIRFWKPDHKYTPGQAGGAEEFRRNVYGKLRTEAVQVAAVALAIVECIDRGTWEWPDEEEIPTGAPGAGDRVEFKAPVVPQIDTEVWDRRVAEIERGSGR